MRGSEIIVSSEPLGNFDAGYILGTPYPGTLLEIVPGTALVGGRFTFRPVTRASGAKGPVAVLLNDWLQGKMYNDAYVSGTFAPNIYWPEAGDELNLLLNDVAGTAAANDVEVGDLFGVETVTGQLIADSSFASAPFMALEAKVLQTADSWLWVRYLGNNA